MGRVWLMVLASMGFTLLASWIWHVDGMGDQDAKNRAAREALIANTAKITAYRDVLRERGPDAAAAYLTQQ